MVDSVCRIRTVMDTELYAAVAGTIMNTEIHSYRKSVQRNLSTTGI